MKKNKLLTIACLCSIACAFTLVSVNTVKNTKIRQEAIRTNEQISARHEFNKQIKEKNETKVENVTVSENINSNAPANEVKKEEAQIKESSVPVKNGKMIAEFTDTVLVFNEMYEDYRTHNGVDISAPLNSPVLAVKKGIITKNEFDYEEGYIVEIEHDDGVVSVYKNLDSDKIVKVGQVVNAGDTGYDG